MTAPRTPVAIGESPPAAAVTVAAGVLGVGVLVLPALTTGRAGVAAWIYHLVAGTLLVLALRRVADGGGVADLARRALGPAPAAAVRWYYLVGVTVGQAAVAGLAGALLAFALGGPRALAPVLALATLAVSAVAAAAGWAFPARTPATAAAAVAVLAGTAVLAPGVLPAALDRAGIAATPPPGLLAAVFLLLFAFVGWESVLRLPGRPVRSAAGGAALVALVSLGAVAAQHAAGAAGAAPGRWWALGAGAVCVVACVRNVATVVRLAATDAPRRPGRPAGPAAVACAATAGIGVAGLAGGLWPLTAVLAVPNAMALAVFVTAATAAAAGTTGPTRLAAAVAGLAYLVLVPVAGPAVLLPLGLLLLCAATIPGRIPCP
jgi:hypothetical protein